MTIKGKAHCFFEQSGTFKREFIKLGIPAEDYDIQNNFGETDHVIDLFHEIEEAYRGGASVFDGITPDDIVMAFFPCIYFCAASQMNMSWTSINNVRRPSLRDATEAILERSRNREVFLGLAIKMLHVAKERGLRLVMENPWSEQTFLKANFVMSPTMIDMDRTRRGDVFRKPTAYFFINCKPTHSMTSTPSKVTKTIMSSKSSSRAGLCSEDRSMITRQYAHNFICDFILGKPSGNAPTQIDMFDQLNAKEEP